MAVRLKYADLTYVKQPDARPLDLTSFREAGAAITAAADNLQERAIRNENAYNEMAIKKIFFVKNDVQIYSLSHFCEITRHKKIFLVFHFSGILYRKYT